MPMLSRDRMVCAPAERVWAALVDWPRHGDWVPLTTITVLTPSVTGVGARFVARTALPGTPVGVDDVMEVTAWQPPQGGAPGRCEVVKQGRVVSGRAVFEVHPIGPDRCRVIWTYDDLAFHPTAGRGPVRLRRGLDRLGRLLTGAVTGSGVSRVLAAMAADVETEAARR